MFNEMNFSIVLDDIYKFLMYGIAVDFILYLIDCVKVLIALPFMNCIQKLSPGASLFYVQFSFVSLRTVT